MHYFACDLSVTLLKCLKFPQFMRCKHMHNQNSESDNASDNPNNNFHKNPFLIFGLYSKQRLIFTGALRYTPSAQCPIKYAMREIFYQSMFSTQLNFYNTKKTPLFYILHRFA